MSGLRIDRELCIGCESCIMTCPQNALFMEDGKAQVDGDACVMCGMCTDSCPVEAISIEKSGTSPMGEAEKGDVWVFAEITDGEIHSCSKELIGKARELADRLEAEAVAVLIGGDSVKPLAGTLCRTGADRVIAVCGEKFEGLFEEEYAAILGKLIDEKKPEILMFGATELGRSLAPRVAAKVGTGLTADCTILEIDEEKRLLKQTRPAFGGNLMATIVCPNHRPQMATVRPGVLPMPQEDENRKIVVEQYDTDVPKPLKELISVVKAESEAKSISDAKIIVSAGRGIGAKKNLALAQELAELLGGEYGVTRPLVDLGWSEYTHQIGQTGCTVAPKLLITCGISGAIQHLAGISGAETVIAINTDKDAPIFARADYAVVGDCVEVLKELIAQLKNK